MDKNKNKPFMTNIENIASCKYFYEVNSKPENYWEEFYCKNIESSLPKIFNNIISAATISQNNATILNTMIKKEMSKIIFSQISRTRKAREFYDDIGNDIKMQIIDGIYKEFDNVLSKQHKEVLEKIRNDTDLIHDMELDTINSDRLLTKGTYYLIDRIWVIYKNLNYMKTYLHD